MTVLMAGARRSAAVAAITSALVVTSSSIPAHAFVAPPIPDIAAAPKDEPPSPEFPMRQETLCVTGGVLPNSDLAQMPPAAVSLRLDQAHKFSTGAGVTVAVIDTGVKAQPRLPGMLPGGDYVADGDGFSDCDGHGTIVAGVIGGAGSGTDGFVGVAPDARIMAIRQTSAAFTLDNSASKPDDPKTSRTAVDIRSLARAIVHAADSGARVINISVAICTKSSDPGDQTMLGGALKYAVDSKDALVVAAAGDVGGGGASGGVSNKCASNPDVNHVSSQDPRNWADVEVVSSPSWFDDLVLSVGFVLPDATRVKESMAGPWVDVAAPGYGIVSLGSGDNSTLINGMPGKDRSFVPIVGSSFAAAFVSGTAALLRSRFPELSAHEVVDRIIATAHPPAGGQVDNVVGHGLIDPLAALTYDMPAGGQRAGTEHTDTLAMPAPDPPPDARPKSTAALVAGLILGLITALWLIMLLVGISRQPRP